MVILRQRVPRPGDERHTPVGLFQALRRLGNARNVLVHFDFARNTLGCAARVAAIGVGGSPPRTDRMSGFNFSIFPLTLLFRLAPGQACPHGSNLRALLTYNFH